MGEKKIRILMAKPGLDGHDRGIKIVSRALREGGMEVIYTGLHQTPQEIVEAAIQEDVDAIGLSILSGAHTTIFPKIMELLKDNKIDIIVFAGGIIPDEDVSAMKNIKITEIFGPGTNTEDIVKFVKEKVGKPSDD
jgi:methylmalonyl-CoA mutase C-terminal domain/subunit